VREIRRAILLNRGSLDDYDSDTEWENADSIMGSVYPPGGLSRPESTTAEIDEYPGI